MAILKIRLRKTESVKNGKLHPLARKESSPGTESGRFGRTRIKSEDVAVFVRQLATMINAGLPILQSLATLQSQQENAGLKGMISSLKESVESGMPLSGAFGKFPRRFNELSVQMVAAGEVGGILDDTLLRLADHMEKVRDIRSKVKGALIYPLVTLFVATLVLIVILVFVIPVFEDMFAQFGAELPVLTQMVIKLSAGVKTHFVFLSLTVFIAVLLFLRWYRTPKGKLFMDGALLRLPVVGELITQSIIARVTRTIASLITSGITLPEALRVTAGISDNLVFAREVDRIRADVVDGKTLELSMGEGGLMPGMVRQMAGVGESTGTLDSMFERTAGFYQDELDRKVGAVTELVEPILMVVLGLVVGVLMISLYLPMFSMATVAGG